MTNPVRYKPLNGAHCLFFTDNLSAHIDIFSPLTNEALIKLAKKAIDASKDKLFPAQTQTEREAALKGLENEYLVLSQALSDFYHQGLSNKATEYRVAKNFNIQDAKVDYYFNWDSRLILHLSENIENPFALFTLTLAASVLLSPFILINSLLQLLPLKHCFSKGLEGDEILSPEANWAFELNSFSV
jgi:hypothetical protein